MADPLQRAARVGVAVAVVGGLLAAMWWWENRPTSELVEAQHEVADLADPAVMGAAVRLARARILGSGVDAPPGLAAQPGRRTFVCAYGVGDPPCAEGLGETLADSVEQAAAGVARARGDWRADRLLVKVDVVQHEEQGWWPDDELHRAAGVDGFRTEGGGFVVPSEVLERGLTPQEDSRRIDTASLVDLLGRRGVAPAPTGFPFTRTRTAAWVEASPGGAVVRTYRTHLYDGHDASDADTVLQSAVWAADHLAASIEPDGRIRYLYDPVRAESPGGYNRLRHAGTTYSLIQAWDRVRVDAWRYAAEAAIGWLLTQTGRDERHGPFGGGDVEYVKEGSHIKLGGAGLALVMLSTWQSATGDDSYRGHAERFARFLVSQQQQSGEFVYFPNRFPGGPPRDDTSAYYPGEAILGLVLWYRLDPQPIWLETAVRGADWLIDERDRGKGPSTLANDHWLMIALSHLYAHTEDPRYLEHSLAIVEAVEWQADRTARSTAMYRDYEGGFYDPPRSTPASTRAEGLVAVLDTCALADRSCPEITARLTGTLGHILTSQYTRETLWWIREPDVVFGGLAGGITDTSIRNDYVQHALSAMLGTERHLLADMGLPGGPAWTAEDSGRFPGVPAPVRRSLRRSSATARGATRWDLRSPPAPDPGAIPPSPEGPATTPSHDATVPGMPPRSQ